VSIQSGAPIDQAIAFGPFRLFPAQQLLLVGDKPLRLGARALAILASLVERPGELVTKEDLMARVWPNTFVEENSLRVHVAVLRKMLGDGQDGNRYIATTPGRGYSFIAPVMVLTNTQAIAKPVEAPEPTSHLPAPLTRMVGRADVVAAIVAQLPERRFTTIAGPGGIGKTTVALAVAEQLGTFYRDGVRFVDLAPVSDPRLVPSALASVLGLAIRSDNPVPGLIAFLKDKHMLLVLDSCEHLVEPVATLAEELFNRAAGVSVLVTSREPLRAEGERVQRLLPWELPASSSKMTAQEAIAFPAVQLFVERATASSDEFRLTDANTADVVNICRRLDGIALAIELAAGRVDVLGVRELAARLDDRFKLLTRGRRTALPRHQTLSATLDWSYELLPGHERELLRRLAIFASRFTLDAARAVASDEKISSFDVTEGLANLVAKSLVTADLDGATVHYRLLETMRAYAVEKLAREGELQPLARRHAGHFIESFRQAEMKWSRMSPAAWRDAYGGDIHDLRAALAWAFGQHGDTEMGVALTIAAVPLWLQLSLMEECRRCVEQAIAAATSSGRQDAKRDMQLAAALGSVLVYTNMGPAATKAWTTALNIADSVGDVDYKLRALWGLWVDSLNNGHFLDALALARQFYEAAEASTDRLDPLMGDRMIGIASHFVGDQIEARDHLDRMLVRESTPLSASHLVRFQFDQRSTALAFQARISWLLGFPEQAMQTIETMLQQAQAQGHVLSYCNTLGQGACPVALWTGDIGAAERYLKLLIELTDTYDLGLWHAWARCYQGVVLTKRGDPAAGLHALRSLLAETPEIRALPRYLGLLGELALALGTAGDLPQALDTIDGAIERSDKRPERWCIAELLRIKGELTRCRNGPRAMSSAEACFQRSLAYARDQSALSWELRTATSLARLQRDRGDVAMARETIKAVYGRFTEGFSTEDLRAAKALLQTMD
jgi:predicted ATPase/DNA-binding winged helix-turn-helix (wHTH) protein